MSTSIRSRLSVMMFIQYIGMSVFLPMMAITSTAIWPSIPIAWDSFSLYRRAPSRT